MASVSTATTSLGQQTHRAAARAIAWPMLFALSCVLALAVTFGYALWSGYRAALADAEETTQKLARALEEHIAGTFVAVDGVLRTTQHHLANAARRGETSLDTTAEILRAGADGLPFIR
jgi:hypothetical protein